MHLNIEKIALYKQSLMHEQPVLYEIWNAEEFGLQFTPLWGKFTAIYQFLEETNI